MFSVSLAHRAREQPVFRLAHVAAHPLHACSLYLRTKCAAPRCAVQAMMPVAVFAVGCGFGTEKYSTATLSNMLTISLGVAVASYGERKAVGWAVGARTCPFTNLGRWVLACFAGVAVALYSGLGHGWVRVFLFVGAEACGEGCRVIQLALSGGGLARAVCPYFVCVRVCMLHLRVGG